MIGAYPGSFDPPTTAHLAIAAAARDRHRLARVDLVVSRVAIGKAPTTPPFDERIAVLRAMARRVGWLDVVVSDAQLIAEMARGYDVVIMGADKWAQVVDPRYYGSPAARDEAVARLPQVAIAPRPPFAVPRSLLLPIDPAHADTSSTRARAGATELMAPEAADADRRQGWWTNRPE